MVDGEAALLNGGSEVTARVLGVFGVKGREGVEGGQQIRRVCSRFQHLLQLPR